MKRLILTITRAFVVSVHALEKPTIYDCSFNPLMAEEPIKL